MSWNGKNYNNAEVVERGFSLPVEDRIVPGVYWTSAQGKNDRLVLLGHGGTRHKKVDYIENLARQLAARGIASLAIDGPGHGDRAQGPFDPKDVSAFARAWHLGGGTKAMLADWKSALDFIESTDGARPTGWWGLSMGTMMGLPVCATEPRIRVAVLGLMGNWGPNGEDLQRLAPDLKIPVRFLVQWDDEIVPRDACLQLFSLLGTAHKTLHANPGKHADVPSFEVAASVEYLDKRLR